MRLTTEEHGDIPDVAADVLDRLLAEDAFGKFAVLSASETRFIQAGNDWQPTDECRAFLAAHDSDPWVLEYRDGDTGKQYRAAGRVTLDQVRQAFRSYRAGGSEWRDRLTWDEVVLSETGPGGVVTTYCPDDGLVLAVATHVGGVRHGPYREFWRDGRVSAEGQYRDGLQDGEWRFYQPHTGEVLVVRFAAGREGVDWDTFFGRSQPAG